MTIDGGTFGGPDRPGELVRLYRDVFREIANDDDFRAEPAEIDRLLDFVNAESQKESMQNRRALWEKISIFSGTCTSDREVSRCPTAVAVAR